MFDASTYDAPLAPWQKRCGHEGPFYVPSYTPKGVRRLVVLVCTRPVHPAGEDHCAAKPDSTVVACWQADGRPVYPRPLPTGGGPSANPD